MLAIRYGHFMDLNLTGKKVMVTGGSRGIGLLRCLRCAEGCDVHLAWSQESLDAAVSAVLKANPDVTVVSHSVDLSKSQDQSALVSAAGKLTFGLTTPGLYRLGISHY